MGRNDVIMDGNEAAASIAYQLSEIIAIYPITPSSTMAELSDEWMSQGKTNLWGTVPNVVEMQSEGGAAGAVHGALQAGALSTTFTASQGLLLMIPNMFKIAGELTPTVFHVSARTLATHALSIFGDHSDVMTCRQTGFAMIASCSPQEVMDTAAIAHAATLESRVPFLHFFDGFRTSHELQKVLKLTLEDLKQLIPDKLVIDARSRAMTPDHPILRGTAQNPDVYFQSREAISPYYDRTAGIVQDVMNHFAKITGRTYHLFDYAGHPEAERVIVLMGSGAETVRETVDALTRKVGEKIGVVMVRLYRPFSAKAFLTALPKTVRSIAVLDRTKEPGALGEPLYQDIITSLAEQDRQKGLNPTVIGGRYGLSSKEFTPAMVKAVFDELKKSTPKNHFTVGIRDDVSNTSLEVDEGFSTEDRESFRGIFIGLGADGTVSANKNSIKIIGEGTDNFAQGYFVYDSKKSGSITKSYLRFGKNPIRSTYLIREANFIACHQFNFLESLNVLEQAEEGATFLLNAPYAPDQVWDHLPRPIQEEILSKKLRFFVVDAYEVARKTGMGGRINTIMQVCFFAIANVIPRDEAIVKIKASIKKSFGKRGDEVVRKNEEAVDTALAHLHEVKVPNRVSSTTDFRPAVSPGAPDFVQTVTAKIIGGHGDSLPVSAFPVDGTFPMGTAKWEKRNIALQIPVWEPDLCIQCGKCALVCPHGVIRIKAYDESLKKNAPEGFRTQKPKGKDFPENSLYTIQVSPEDCTGCVLCVEVCPAKDKSQAGRKSLNMVPIDPVREQEKTYWNYFDTLPYYDRSKVKPGVVKDCQLLEPLFEFSGACSGCGETPYIKLATQLFGDRMMIANATGCSSIYGGNLPTTPYTTNGEGRGPTWSNSLFEDNAEFGMGMRLAIAKKSDQAVELLKRVASSLPAALVDELILHARDRDEASIVLQRRRISELKGLLAKMDSSEARHLTSLADYLTRKSVWIIGGDGWGYDIGYGGLDHVLASGVDVNVLLLDTEVYSNTGGQMSKSTPIGAVAKFAASGKASPKKDLGLLSISYGNIYVARVAFGSSDLQTLKAMIEAEEYDGPSIIIAYSHCIAHGYDMRWGLKQQQNAVDSGYWPLYRYNPSLMEKGENPFKLDSKPPKIPLTDYIYNETRYKMLTKSDPERAAVLARKAQALVHSRWRQYEGLVSSLEPVKKPLN